MPPKGRKRGAPVSKHDRSKKRAKRARSASASARATSRRRSSSASHGSRTSGRREIHWVLPRVSRAKLGYDWNTAEAFAPVLYNQPWASLRNVQSGRLELAHLQSPVCRFRTIGQRSFDRAHEQNRSSRGLIDFYDRIRTETSNEWSLGRYCWHNFVTAFGEENGEYHAIVASDSQPPFALDQDYAVLARLRGPRGENEVSTIRILRRQLESGVGPEYFVWLPGDTSVTVNGLTYTNLKAAEDFFIGPLQGFSIIELSSQPIFFYKSKEDVRSDNHRKADDIPDAEFEQRHELGNATTVELEFRGLENSAGGGSAYGGSTDGGADDGDDSGAEDDPNDEDESGAADNPDSRDYSGSENAFESIADAFDGLSACEYLRRRLAEVEDQIEEYRREKVDTTLYHLLELVSTVLLAIDARQSDNAGFSVPMAGRASRPGRPFIFHLSSDQDERITPVLLIVQFDELQRIIISVMDPMEWNSTKERRSVTHNEALAAVLGEGWLYNIAADIDSVLESLPHYAQWIDSAQVADVEQAGMFTFLNSWALAMGLTPDADFGSEGHPAPSDEFFNDAASLGYLARSGKHLDWKLVLAFFYCHKFVEPQDALPPVDRRFNLNRTPGSTLIQRELHKDITWRNQNQDLHFEDFVEGTNIELSNGRPHDQDFRSDVQSAEFRDEIVKSLILHNAWDRTSTDDVLQRRYRDLHPVSPSSSPSSPSSRRRSSGSSRRTSGSTNASSRVGNDTSDIEDRFNACEYFDKTIEHLGEQHEVLLDGKNQGLKNKEIFDSIAAVTQAITRIRDPGQGFGLLDFGTLQSFKCGTNQPDALGQRTDQPLIIPWFPRYQSHNLLFTIQTGEDGHVAIHAIDTAPWTSKQEAREEMFHSLCDLIHHVNATDFERDSNINWIMSLQQSSDLFQAGYYTVLNAWAVAFDLPLNPGFQPGRGFFQYAKQLVDLVLGGFADWKLIWSFLRCKDFVSANAVPIDRRITRTIASGKLNKNLLRLRKRVEMNEEPAAEGISPYPFPLGRQHKVQFPSDKWSEEDRGKLPKLLDAGISVADLSGKGLREAWVVETMNPKWSRPEKDWESPCSYLREEIKKAVKKENVKKSTEKLKRTDEITLGPNWLKQDEVSLAIASVTLAVTTIQNATEGYSYIPDIQVQICGTSGSQNASTNAIRFGRPMLVSFHHEYHIILLVLQLDEQNNPSISILDSRPYHWSRKDRGDIYNATIAIIRESGWLRGVFPDAGAIRMPQFASWVPCAFQTESWNCGYHTIFNGWALALGLEINVDFKWNNEGQLLEHAELIVQLARIGHATWRMILAFLVCYKFVKYTKSVAELKQFSNTLRVMNAPSVEQSLRNLRESEERFWKSPGGYTIQHVMGRNRIHFPRGRRHDYHWGCDDWTDFTKNHYVNELVKHGPLNLEFDNEQIEADYKRLSGPDGKYEKLFLDFRSSIKGKTHDQKSVIRALQDYLHLWSGDQRIQNSHFEKIEEDDCEFAHEHIFYYNSLFKLWKGDKRVHKFPKIGDELELQDLALGIASVVEAIDDHQAQLHQPRSKRLDPFAGGFTISSVASLSMGLLDRDIADDPHYIASRPRRCWLMPLVINGHFLEEVGAYLLDELGPKHSVPQDGHIILAVIQEEFLEITEDETEKATKPENKCYCIYLLDSMPEYLEAANEFIFTRIQEIAKGLNWTTHCGGENIRFVLDVQLPKVAKQTNNWACGYHVIVNAWILAMGLVPNHDAEFTPRLYNDLYELIRLALGGYLDWKTLFAWLKCHSLITARSADYVLDNRRFKMTSIQTTDNKLFSRIRWIYEGEDAALVSLYSGNGDWDPYDHSNNVDFNDANWQFRYGWDPGSGLGREMENADIWENSDEMIDIATLARRWKRYDPRKATFPSTGLGTVAMTERENSLSFLDGILDPGTQTVLL